MKIIFVKDYNTPQQGFDKGQVCEVAKKEADTFIKGKFAKKATNAEVKAAQASSDEDDK